MRKYSYSYDDLNRLRKAYFQKPYDVVSHTQSFDEYIDYDKNGNIDRLQRFADQNEYGNVIEIDALGYHYEQHSNKLMKVTDATNFSAGFGDDSDGTNDTDDDYAYDDNGNMISDENKGITTIKYNHLNLPLRIYFENGNRIHYLYTASGVKVGKTVYQGSQAPVVTDYLGGFQYVKNELQFFPHPEGYVSVVKFGPETLVINYAYQYKDHLGNIRLNYGKDPETNVLKVLEENHYYPFGLKHQNYNTGRRQLGKKEEILAGNLTLMPAFVLPTEEKPMVYKYKYNGKEWQDELGLNLTAMDFRMYDNALGRFHNIDVMTEVMPSLSPYRFAFNNPVIWKDPTGLLEETDPPTIHLKEVVVSATRKSTKSVHDTGLPYNHSYFLMPKNYRPVSTDYYNKKYGTDFKNLDDWYYRTKYLPFKEEMIRDMHSAQAKAGMAVMALVGSAFATPFLVASSPAAISAVSATISHPLTQYSFSMGLASAFSQQLVKGEVDQADVAISMIPGGSGVQALKPMFSSAIDLSSKEGFKLAGINKSDTSFYRDAATGYIFHGLSFGASPANDLRGLGEIPLNTVLNAGQDSMNKMLELQGLK